MALSLLAGPFPIVSPKGANLTNFDVYGVWPGVGVMAASSFAGNGILTLDGVFEGVSLWNFGTCGWWMGANKMLHLGADHQEYVLEPHTFMRVGMVPEDTVGELAGGVNYYVRVGNKRFYVANRNVYCLEGEVATSVGWTPPYSMVLTGRGRNESELFVYGLLDNKVCCSFFDLETYTFSEWMYPDFNPSKVFYVPEFGVIGTFHNTNGVIRIWSTEVKPITLSSPELYAGETKGGRLATYRVRATGSNGDSCVGEIVNWVRHGAGLLLQDQSTTDESGYATTRVRFGLYDTGRTEVEASLTC